MGLQSSAYNIPLALQPNPGTGALLSANIEFIADEKDFSDAPTNIEVSLNGNSGVVRLWFALKTAADANTTVIITKGGGVTTDKSSILNGDNGFVIRSNGNYRFDIGVRPGDILNLKSTVSVTATADVLELKMQQIQIGA